MKLLKHFFVAFLIAICFMGVAGQEEDEDSEPEPEPEGEPEPEIGKYYTESTTPWYYTRKNNTKNTILKRSTLKSIS